MINAMKGISDYRVPLLWLRGYLFMYSRAQFIPLTHANQLILIRNSADFSPVQGLQVRLLLFKEIQK